MSQYDINSNDPLEMVWAIREQIQEETKDMTREEYREHVRKASEWMNREIEHRRQQIAADRAAGIPVKFPWE